MNGQFKAGNAGRPKGSKNKKSRDAKLMIEKVLKKLDKKILEDIEFMSRKARVNLWLSLIAYTIPKPKAKEEKEVEEKQDFTINFVDAEGNKMIFDKGKGENKEG